MDSASCPLTRVETLPTRAVEIDGRGRFRVRGKPFFPIGLTLGMSVPRRDWPTIVENHLKGGPFNLLLIYEVGLTKEELDNFYANGLMVKFNLKDVYSNFPKVRPPAGVETEADEVRFVTEKVNLFKDHPGLFAWYLNDEFPVSMADRTAKRRALIRSLDPGHPTCICVDRPATLGAFMDSFDFAGTDPYPVGLKGKKLRQATDWVKVTCDQLLGLKPAMQTVQAFDWKWFFKTWSEVRMPTREEMRSMTWQQIVGGAEGVGFFSYSCLAANLKGEEFERAWGDVVAVAAEVKAMAPVMLSDEPAPAVESVSTPDVAVRAWRYKGVNYLVAAEIGGKTVEARVKLAGESEPRVISLPAYGVAFKR